MRIHAVLWTITAVLVADSSSQDAEPAPLVIPASEYFEGNDGPWSTFDIRVGTPDQDIRVLVSTASPQALVPFGEQACSTSVFKTVPSGCAVSRGNLFNQNQSSTWHDVGLYGINQNGVGLEANLGYQERVEFGLDHLALGLTGPGFDNQTVGGIAAPEPFYLGILGINPQPVNYSTLGNFTSPSLFTTLKDQGKTPSLSWSYTAGAKYRLKQVYGQLIFGGYDTSRFDENPVSFSMADDVTRDLVVALQSISYSGSTSATLLSNSIDIMIDSTDPNLWLPADVCDAFEHTFGLTLDTESGLYLVNDTHRNALLDSNPQVTFRLSDVKSGGDTVTVVLPYAAFDLTAENPLVSNTSHYFPLKRANSSTQYTLGRTFLQEAYLSVDYERKVFNVSACTWNQGAQQNIVTIPPANSTSGSGSGSGSNSGGNGSSSSSSSNGSGLSGGAIAGIVIGSVLGALLIAGLLFIFLLRKRRKWLGVGFAAAAKDPAPDDSVLNGPVFNSPSARHDSTPDSSTVPYSAADVSAAAGPRSTAEFVRPGSSTADDSESHAGSHASSSPPELDGQDTLVRPNTEIDGHEVSHGPLPPVAENPDGVFELPGSEPVQGVAGSSRQATAEKMPLAARPSTAGSSVFGDGYAKDVRKNSTPSPLTATSDKNPVFGRHSLVSNR